MAIVEMKCPNCGGKMDLINNQFMCPNCRTMVLNIMDAKIDDDVTVMSPEEFSKKIDETYINKSLQFLCRSKAHRRRNLVYSEKNRR